MTQPATMSVVADNAYPESVNTLRWSAGERVLAELLLFLFVWAVTSLLLALSGWFHWWLVVPFAVVIWLLTRRMLPRAIEGFDVWWKAALAVAIVLGLFNSFYPGEHLFTGRDSGTYLATAGWLAEESTLYVDARSGALGEAEGLEFAVPGFYDIRDDGLLEPQFMHAFPSMMATVADAIDIEASLRMNALIGAVVLLALFALGRRWIRPWIALLVMITVGLGLVFTYYARTPFSEMLTAAFVVGGLWMLGVAEDRWDLRIAVLSGALLGGATLIRLDGIVLLLPVTAYLLIRGGQGADHSSLYGRARLAMVAVAVLGLAESLFISPAYVLGRRHLVLPVLVAWLLVFLLVDVMQRKHLFRGISLEARIRLFWTGSFVLGALLAFAWLLRPLIADGGGGYGIDLIQRSQGLEVDPNHPYLSMAVDWLSWYHGPAFVVFGFFGIVAMSYRSLFTRKVPSPGWLIPAVLLVFSVLYIWRPSINPDQIWAMRRFLPVVIPIGMLASGFVIERVLQWAGDRRPSIQLALGGILSASLLVPTLLTFAPVWDVHEFAGLADDFEQVCEDIGPSTHVLIMDDGYGALGHRLTQSFRSYCGVQSAWNGSSLSEEQISNLRAEIAASGGELVLVWQASETDDDMILAGPYEYLELTVTEPPDEKTRVSPGVVLGSTISDSS